MTRTATTMITTTMTTAARRTKAARRRPGVRRAGRGGGRRLRGRLAGHDGYGVGRCPASPSPSTAASTSRRPSRSSAAFEKKTGITVNVRYDDEDTFTDEIVAEKSHPEADVFYTENSPPLEYLQKKGLLAKVDPSTLAKTAEPVQLAAGDWVGVSARVSVLIYNPSLIKKSQLPTTVLQLANPKYSGKLAFAAGETDFQPIVTSVDHTYGQAKTLAWLDGIKANAGGHVYPDNETIADEVNRGAVAFGVVNQYYWYRMKAELGAAQHPLEDHLLRPARPGLRPRRLGRGDPEVVEAPGGGAEVPGLPGLRAGPGDHRPLDQLRVPARRRGGDRGIPETPFAQLQPNPITIAELGDGSTAISLLRQAGLL